MKISVIIPAYNCAGLIEKCIDSILSQKGAELDVIVIDDGSDDGTPEVLKRYGDRIRTKSIPNGGSSAARNVGIEMIEGDYVMFVDADDYLSEGTVELLVSEIEKTDADVIKFRYRLIFPDGGTLVRHNQFDKYEIIEKPDFKKKVYPYFLKGIRLNSMCTGIFRASLIKGRKFREDMRVAEDAVFSLGTITLAKKIVFLPDILYDYYQSGTSLTGTGASLYQKYHCNFIVSRETAKLLKEWDMDDPITRIRVYLRAVILTFNKVFRMISNKFEGR